MKDRKLLEIINSLKSSITFVDFRSISIEDRGSSKYILSTFRFTSDQLDVIKWRQEQLNNIKPKQNRFKFNLEVLGFDDWESKWKQISQQKWNLQWNEMVIYNKTFSSPPRRVFTAQDYNKTCSIEIYYNLENPGIIHETLELLAKDLEKEGVNNIYSLISRFHEIENYGKNNHLFVAFIIPIPLKIYFDTLSFYNNYFFARFQFHESFKNSKLYIKLTSADELNEYKHEIKLSLKSPSLESLGNSFYQDEIYFRVPDKTSISLGKEARYKIYMPRINLGFIIDYEDHLKTIIRKKSEYLSLIPASIQEIFASINSFDMSDIQKFNSNTIDFLKSMNLERIRELFEKIKNQIDWLLHQNSKMILKEYSRELANRNSAEIFWVFRDMLIIILNDSINDDIIHDEVLEDKANDLIIKYGLGEFDEYAVLLHIEEPFVDFKLEISRFVEDIYHNILNCTPYSGYNNQIIKLRERHIVFPKRDSICEISLDSERSCFFHLFLNDTSRFKHKTVFITFSRPKDVNQMWESIDSELIENLALLLDRALKMSSIKVIGDVFLPISISSKMSQKLGDGTMISEEDSKWISQLRFKAKNTKEKLGFDFKNLNIFIGKNNSGKSHSLTSCFLKIKSGVYFDFPERARKFKENHKGVAILDMFYIPERRVISKSFINVQSLKEELKLFFKDISNLKSDVYLKLEGGEVSPENDKDIFWKIPDLLRLVDLCLIQDNEINNLSEEGRTLFSLGNYFFRSLEKIYNSWKYWIEFFFPDIEVNPPQGTERGRRKTSSFKDKSLGINISNWKWFGSGTQQLLNMIFLIEFLKFGPSINYKQLQGDLENQNYENAFNYTYLERNCRILFIDEPEVSLHPGLQKKFFEYIYDASKFIQVFIATQSPYFLSISNFLERDINLVLCQKRESHENPFSHKIIKKKDLILIYNDIFHYSIKEVANFLSTDDYYYLSFKKEDLSYDFKNLDMIKNLLKFIREDNNYRIKIRDLGRTVEEFETRMIQNATFLCVDPPLCELGKTEGKIEKVFFGQYLVNPINNYDKKSSLLELYKIFYDSKCLEMKVLCLKEDTVPILYEKLKTDLRTIEQKIIKKRSLFIFQENLFSYTLIKFLIDFATEHEIVIVGGLEHITLEKFKEFIENLPSNLKERYQENKSFSKLLRENTLRNNDWINQVIIINAAKKFSFQIKNVPFHTYNITENIPIIQYPCYSIYNTIMGKIVIFICKDFLVNYPVIDKWMDKHEVKYAIIPSNTNLVNPFIRKFGEIINFKKNNEKHFFFVNIAEFSGSGMFRYKNRTDYEPGTTTFFSRKQEGILPIEL